MIEIHQSGIDAYRRCPRLYAWGRTHQTIDTPTAISRGITLHAELHAWGDSLPTPSTYDGVVIREMVTRYMEGRTPPDRTEVPWSFPLGSGMVAAGRADALRGDTVIDYKLTSRNAQHLADTIAITPQAALYAHAFGATTWELHIFTWPRIAPHEATPHEKRRYTKSGALYASQRERDESLDEWRIRVREVLEPMRVVRRHVESIDVLDGVMRTAERMRDDRHWDPHSTGCMAYGRPCDFLPACRANLHPAQMPELFLEVV